MCGGGQRNLLNASIKHLSGCHGDVMQQFKDITNMNSFSTFQ